MARLQDFQTVTPSGSDKLLIVQSQGQGLSTLDAVVGVKMNKSNPTGTGTLTMTGSGTFSGDLTIMGNKSLNNAISRRNSYLYSFPYLTSAYSLTSTNYTDVFTGVTKNIQEGAYSFSLSLNAKWTLSSAFFNGEIKFDTDNVAVAPNVYAEATDGTIIFYGRIVLSQSGNHTIQPAFKVTDANKVVTIKPYTTPMLMLIRE